MTGNFHESKAGKPAFEELGNCFSFPARLAYSDRFTDPTAILGMTLEMHQNLRANVGRLWFAGEATSAAYYGFLQAAYYEGKEVGERIAGMLTGNCLNTNYNDTGTGNITADGVTCGNDKHYAELHGSTPIGQFAEVNGWDASSFVAYGYYSDD